jgi:hypothetical protein
MADNERANRSVSLNEAISEAERACVEYAAVGDALGYPGVRGRELLLNSVRELGRWLRDSTKKGPSE